MQEVNAGFQLSAKWGSISFSFGLEGALGNSNKGFNSACRVKSQISIDGKKTLKDLKTFLSIPTQEAKVSLGAKFSNKPTLKSGTTISTNNFKKSDATIFGSGIECKVGVPDNLCTRSYNIGIKEGNSKSIGINRTIGREWTTVHSSLATDRNDGGY
ncbi:hypothetical protein [Flavobacterium branchiophilum]|uniref:Uncharacterized protein n=1 Tax=Flavobacterium branchiophilum TaxID=55197 RepID=A0A2H3KA68_9FLAO|nr:hypothetical protein [Flavobacterium branchiophilum]PDS22035.1 hypothetical protein B0A77_14420 [Flavobacterium branchiophilum]